MWRQGRGKGFLRVGVFEGEEGAEGGDIEVIIGDRRAGRVWGVFEVRGCGGIGGARNAGIVDGAGLRRWGDVGEGGFEVGGEELAEGLEGVEGAGGCGSGDGDFGGGDVEGVGFGVFIWIGVEGEGEGWAVDGGGLVAVDDAEVEGGGEVLGEGEEVFAGEDCWIIEGEGTLAGFVFGGQGDQRRGCGRCGGGESHEGEGMTNDK